MFTADIGMTEGFGGLHGKIDGIIGLFGKSIKTIDTHDFFPPLCESVKYEVQS